MRASRVWAQDDSEREGRTSERERHTLRERPANREIGVPGKSVRD